MITFSEDLFRAVIGNLPKFLYALIALVLIGFALLIWQQHKLEFDEEQRFRGGYQPPAGQKSLYIVSSGGYS